MVEKQTAILERTHEQGQQEHNHAWRTWHVDLGHVL
jgi:hypothetical protein